MADTVITRDAEGKPVRVPLEELARHKANSGEYNSSQSTLPEEQARAEQWQNSENDRIAKQYGTIGAGAAGLVNGVTLGAAGAGGAIVADSLGATGVAGDIRRDATALGRNTAYKVGDVAGMVAPALLSGGEAAAGEGVISQAFRMSPAGLVGQAGTAAERLATRLLPESAGILGQGAKGAITMGARGAAEGALLSMGQTVSDNIIANKPLTAEAIASSGLDGALYGGLVGGGLGAGIGVGSATIGRGLEHITGSAASRLGREANEGRMLETLGASRSAMADIGAQEGGQTSFLANADKILEKGDLKLSSPPEAIRKLAKATADESGDLKAAITKKLDVSAPGTKPSFERFETLVNETVQPRLNGFLGASGLKNKVTDLMDELKSIHGEGVKNRKPWTNWSASRDAMSEKIIENAPGMAADSENSIRKEIRGLWDSEFRTAMGDSANKYSLGPLAEQYASAAITQSTAKTLLDMTENRLSKSGTSLLNPTDVGRAAVVGALGHPLFAVGGLAAKAAARGLEDATMPHIANALYKMSLGVGAANMAAQVTNKINGAVKGFFRAAGTTSNAVHAMPKSKPVQISRAIYDADQKRTELLTSPAHRMMVMDVASNEEHPELGEAMLGNYDNAVAHIQASAPVSRKDKGGASLRVQGKEKGLSMQEYKHFSISQAIKKPLATLETGLKDGTLTSDQSKAIREVYPEIHSLVVQQVMNNVEEMKNAGKGLPIGRIAQLGILLDAPIDSILEPDFVNAIQASFQKPAAPAEGGSGGGDSPQAPSQIKDSPYQVGSEKVMS